MLSGILAEARCLVHIVTCDGMISDSDKIYIVTTLVLFMDRTRQGRAAKEPMGFLGSGSAFWVIRGLVLNTTNCDSMTYLAIKELELSTELRPSAFP